MRFRDVVRVDFDNALVVDPVGRLVVEAVRGDLLQRAADRFAVPLPVRQEVNAGATGPDVTRLMSVGPISTATTIGSSLGTISSTVWLGVKSTRPENRQAIHVAAFRRDDHALLQPPLGRHQARLDLGQAGVVFGAVLGDASQDAPWSIARFGSRLPRILSSSAVIRPETVAMSPSKTRRRPLQGENPWARNEALLHKGLQRFQLILDTLSCAWAAWVRSAGR